MFLLERTGKGFLRIKNTNVSLGPVETATDFLVTNCQAPSFALNFRDNNSMNSLDMSGDEKQLVALEINKGVEQCFRLVLTPKNDFVIMHGSKCLRFDDEKTKQFYREDCDRYPTFFNVLFETSVIHGEDLPRSGSGRKTAYNSASNKNYSKGGFSAGIGRYNGRYKDIFGPSRVGSTELGDGARGTGGYNSSGLLGGDGYGPNSFSFTNAGFYGGCGKAHHGSSHANGHIRSKYHHHTHEKDTEHLHNAELAYKDYFFKGKNGNA